MTDLTTPQDIAALPDGTVFESLPTCLWPQRYAGVRWKKVGTGVMPINATVASILPIHPSLIPFFKDPLPARVVEESGK